MRLAVDICIFTLDRVRTVLLALSLMVLMKTAWMLIAPVG